MRKVTLIVLTMITLLATSSLAFPINIIKDDKIDSNIWQKLEHLYEIEELVKDNKRVEALIMLEALLDQYPDYKEAKELYSRLNSADDGKTNDIGDEAIDDIEAINRRWLEFQKLKKAGQLSEARNILQTINKLKKEKGVKPTFLSDLYHETEAIDAKIGFVLNSKLESIRAALSNSAEIEDVEERLSKLVALYKVVKEILSKYDGFVSVEILRTSVLKQLDKSARIVYAKAIVLKNLEGCDLALNQFKKLLSILSYKELSINQKARAEVKRCEE